MSQYIDILISASRMCIFKTVDINVTQNLRNVEEVRRIGPTPMILTSWEQCIG
jgi:hypothetical protein